MNSTMSEIDRFTECDQLVVRQAMAFLAKRELEVVVLHYWEGLSETEIAMALRTDWRTVEKIMGRALLQLRETCLSRPEFSRYESNPAKFQADPEGKKRKVNEGISYANQHSH